MHRQSWQLHDTRQRHQFNPPSAIVSRPGLSEAVLLAHHAHPGAEISVLLVRWPQADLEGRQRTHPGLLCLRASANSTVRQLHSMLPAQKGQRLGRGKCSLAAALRSIEYNDTGEAAQARACFLTRACSPGGTELARSASSCPSSSLTLPTWWGRPASPLHNTRTCPA